MKLINYIAVLIIPSIIILLSLNLVIHDFSFYKSQFNKHNVYDNINISKDIVDTEAKNLIRFFHSKTELTIFNEDEKSHLQDVKILLSRANIWLVIFTILFLIIIFYFNNKTKTLFYGSILTLVVMALFLVINFNSLFIKFHEAFFIGNWTFDPASSIMINMFPQEFFYAAAVRILVYTLIISLLIIAKYKYTINKQQQK